MKDLTPTELRTHLETADPVPLLVDVREAWEFNRVHLPDSIHLPLGMLQNALTHFEPEQTLVMICHHGIRSMHAALFLERAGFKHVINLRGGIDAWARDLDPHMPVY